MKQKEYMIGDTMGMQDRTNCFDHPMPCLKGIIEIRRKNKLTGEEQFVTRSSNVITISGYQWILMKMFNLFLDSSHGKVTDNLTRNTTLAMPDVNERMMIGTNPNQYQVMQDDITMSHFCQGFMIGNGGAGEDSVTTKNTAYSFINLRNPIPFQQSLTNYNTTIASKYLGGYYGPEQTAKGKMVNSCYIKKFDTTPHIYHSWWVDGQRWDYVDPVTVNDLGPNAINGTQKTNRIETYVECQLSLSDTDCQAYFSHVGNTQTAMINELGLVAFDTTQGDRSKVEDCYRKQIQDFLHIVYLTKGDRKPTVSQDIIAKQLALEIHATLDSMVDDIRQKNLINFLQSIPTSVSEGETLDYVALQETFAQDDNIGVQAYYNQNDTLQYTTDKFLQYLQDPVTNSLSLDEAQRIKLITYYTFPSIPISKNWEILINYRIYAN